MHTFGLAFSFPLDTLSALCSFVSRVLVDNIPHVLLLPFPPNHSIRLSSFPKSESPLLHYSPVALRPLPRVCVRLVESLHVLQRLGVRLSTRMPCGLVFGDTLV